MRKRFGCFPRIAGSRAVEDADEKPRLNRWAFERAVAGKLVDRMNAVQASMT
jgi:hypothetical protein